MTTEERLIAYTRLAKAMMITTVRGILAAGQPLPPKLQFKHLPDRSYDCFSLLTVKGDSNESPTLPKHLAEIYRAARVRLQGVKGLGLIDKPQTWEPDKDTLEFDWEWAQQELRKYDKQFPRPGTFERVYRIQYSVRRTVELKGVAYISANSLEEALQKGPPTGYNQLTFSCNSIQGKALDPPIRAEEVKLEKA